MSKIQVDKLDPFRILLTETLPYETPLFFSNILLYKYARGGRQGKERVDTTISYAAPRNWEC
jgi:hypothetical protein